MSKVARGGRIDDKASALVNQIFKSDDILQENEIIKKLRDIYHDDDKLIGKAHKYFVKRFNAINEHAKEFKIKLLTKYQYMDLTKIMKKAAEYAAKYRMTPAEYHLFLNLVKKDNSGKFNKYTYEERTDMGKALGYEPKKFAKLSYNTDDKKYLDSILAFYKASRELNKKVKISTLTYRDCDPVVIQSKYDKHLDNKAANNIIHPLIAAMFIPKISGFDTRMLMTSIPYIITTIYNGDEVKDLPNKFLYGDIVTDKNQPAYSSMTPYQDLYTRSVLQAKLWEAVLQLRNGHFYHFNNDEFNEIIGKYPANIFDAPDMLFTQDAGNILRRIMNAFSFNPTLVRVTKTTDKYFSDSTNEIFKHKVDNDKKYVSVVPMINIRLPSIDDEDKKSEYKISISDNITSSQWFSNEKNITPVSYEQKIINSEDVLIFYVNRNFNTISINTETQDEEQKLLNRHDINNNNIYQSYVQSLPLMFSNVQKINDMEIDVEETLYINNHIFKLRSVVTAESINVADTHIIGETSAIIFQKDDKGDAYYYNPLKADKTIENTTAKYSPITLVKRDSAINNIKKHGMVYIYYDTSSSSN